ncbi:phosphoglycolate phosphatase [Aquicoccus sp. G2-2]|uniref:phosphoglycolate phosphatase n=1 Tax=Aquicoccus sp. G2-2 TaxID=3092120 RepID=UPI002ADFADD5|nr:phosphoglycolate phosphatase [Aquicoccus sp. G2-2]MEA1114946.1 phosphoglycolate phosphatase [Aquicoccus sp. G2-2]
MKAIVFDLDGTLIDSAPDICAAVNKLLDGEGLKPLSRAEVISFVGNGLPKLVERVMRKCGIAPARHADLTRVTLDFYSAASSDLTRCYPDVIDALTALAAEGYALGICTNKPEAPARAILDELGLARFFNVVVGGDTFDVKKPDAMPLWQAFEALGASARLFVGDSEVDAETARNAGVDFALFTEGYRKTPAEQFLQCAQFDDFTALPGIARDTFAADAG